MRMNASKEDDQKAGRIHTAGWQVICFASEISGGRSDAAVGIRRVLMSPLFLNSFAKEIVVFDQILCE